MFCTNCGAQVPDGQKFCTNCGVKLQPAEQAEQPSQAADSSSIKRPHK
ncbi:zinc-ribbon domain-containing protein [Lancefieldella rimae]